MQKIDTTLMDRPIDCYLSVFHRQLQQNYSILPQSSTTIPTDYDPSVFHRELQKNYNILPYSSTTILTAYARQYFTKSCKKNYSPCNNHRRLSRRMVHIPICVTVRLPGRSAQLPTDVANPMHLCSDTQLPMDLPTDFKKSGGIFKILVRISKNTDGI
jgi:hypothetical protein